MENNGYYREMGEFSNSEDSELNIDSSTEHADAQPKDQPSCAPLQQEKCNTSLCRKRFTVSNVSRSEAFEVLNIDSSRLAL